MYMTLGMVKWVELGVRTPCMQGHGQVLTLFPTLTAKRNMRQLRLRSLQALTRYESALLGGNLRIETDIRLAGMSNATPS
ncbi:hypothetical protein [Mesorhizobium sp. M0060]|uniref:hypothetical protein n=1 Tax=Mesorhizobium sp. M0060 TaxID=2956866 RepID=UPI003337D82A